MAGDTVRSLLTAFLSFAAFGGLAAAQDSQRVYIVAVPVGDGVEAETARVGAAARAALRNQDGVIWDEADQRFLGYDTAALTQLEQARSLLEEGRTAYLNLELAQAIELLTSAVQSFDASAAAMEDPSDLGDALLFLGASQVFNGDTRSARDTFARLHIQMPHITPDPDTFNPDVVSRYEQAAPRDMANPSGSITVESEPGGAIAYVDFIPRGISPVQVDALMFGTHVVRVTRPGATPFVQQVELGRRSGTSQTINAFLEDHEDAIGLADAVDALSSSSVDSMDADGPAAEIARQLNLDKIGIIRVSSTGSTAQVGLEFVVFDVATGRRLVRGENTVPTAPGQLEAAVGSAVAGGLRAALAPQQGADSERIIPDGGEETPWGEQQPPEESGGDSVLKKWWFWTIIGGAVVLTALTIGLATRDDSGPPLGQSPDGAVVFRF